MQKQQDKPIKEFKVINVDIDNVSIDPENPNKMSGDQMSGLKASMEKFGYLEPIIVDQNNMIADGEHRLLVYKDLNMKKIPAFRVDLKTDAERKLLRQTMNKLRGQHDPELDSQELLLLYEKDMLPELESLIGQDLNELKRLVYDFHPDKFSRDIGIAAQDGNPLYAGGLSERWGIPPFSVLDRRTQTWQERRRLWLDFGIASEQGRENVVLFASHLSMRLAPRDKKTGKVDPNYKPTVSVFDPVIAEIMIRWFCVPSTNAKILDPFCGGSVRGIVSSFFGHHYTGVDLRQEQVDANYRQYDVLKDRMPKNHIKPEWIAGDSRNISKIVKKKEFDFLLTSPPYYKIEHYSDLANDLNNMNWSEFKKVYREIIHASCDLMNKKKPSFVAWNVGNARDPQSRMYVNQQDITKQYFYDKGFQLQNEFVLIHPAYSLPFRLNNMFLPKRTVPKQHEYVLVFYNGTHKDIPKIDPMVVDIPGSDDEIINEEPTTS